MTANLPNTVSPRHEMHSWETLWGMNGQTAKSLHGLFEAHKVSLPSEALERAQAQELFDKGLAQRVWEYLKALQVRLSVAVFGAYQYPMRLRDARYPLPLFYYRGDIGLAESRCISIVGARKCSPAGAQRAARLARELTNADFTIVSGLAAGIDTAAMQSAIDVGGRTIGVIGTPLNEVYPKENAGLQEKVATEHLLISQVPFYRYKQEPFTAHRVHFPERNVTMAALSQATVIVEASETSGTHTQARACMAQPDRKLFILNSCFESGLKWPAAYEEQGAIRVRSTEDILAALNGSTNGNGHTTGSTVEKV